MDELNYRLCKCCDKKYFNLRPIRCRYCGQSVEQNLRDTKYGKHFHNECTRDFTNLVTMLRRINLDSYDSNELILFKDVVLVEMIQRHDLRILHKHMHLMIKAKGPFVLFLKNPILQAVA